MNQEMTIYQYMDDMLAGSPEAIDFNMSLANAVENGLIELYEDRIDYLPEGLENDINDNGLKVFLPR